MKGFRSFLVSAAVFVAGVIQLYDPAIWAVLVKPEYRPYVTMGLGVLLFILRLITNTPPGKKAP